MMQEFWLPVIGFEGLYAVSDRGRVRSLSRTVSRKGNSDMVLADKVLKPGITKDGYALVVLSKDGKKTSVHVHALVASAFIAKPEGRVEVDHREPDRSNNEITNLRWATRSQNNGNSRKTRGMSRFKGVYSKNGL